MAATSVPRSPRKPEFKKLRIGTASKSANEMPSCNGALLIEQGRLVKRLKPLFQYAYHTNDWDEDLNCAIMARAELESLVEGWNREVVVSHVRQIPAEILTDIFLLAEGDAPYDVLNTSPGRGPHRFAQVCRRWRSVALNYTPLWARLHVKISRATKLSGQTLAHLERVLTLSHHRLIDVKFDMGLILDVDCWLAASHLWALTSHCGRWQKVHLNMPTLLVKNIEHHILDGLSALEFLSVTDLPLAPHVGFIPIMTELSSLTTLSLKFTAHTRQRDTELQLFTERLSAKDFLPRLACVEMDFCYVFYPVPGLQALNRAEFVRMLQIRCSEGALRCFKLTSSGESLMSEEQQESVKKLVKYGLTTDIRLQISMICGVLFAQTQETFKQFIAAKPAV
ncbi:hypothetical protein BDZ89DRAFT_1040932 [Hymenopellis radicata]|nr:hypothetical protein BDZ89DRAFT_1040932 [Hymenopellis radicata]